MDGGVGTAVASVRVAITLATAVVVVSACSLSVSVVACAVVEVISFGCSVAADGVGGCFVVAGSLASDTA